MFTCELCEFNTNYESVYKEHLRSQNHFLKTGNRLEDYRYCCLPCGFKTFYFSKYKDHENSKSHILRLSGYCPVKYKCELCNYWSYVKNNFNTHMYRHRKNENYKKKYKKENNIKKVNNYEFINDKDLLKNKISEEVIRLYEKGLNPNNHFNYTYYALKNLNLSIQELNVFLWELRKIN